MIKAEIIQDSINPVGNRLTTFVLEYPRFIHAELLTHRVFSKNSASSRAIPIEKMIKQIEENPAMPEYWGKNQSGMQAKEELDDIEKNIITNYEEKGTSHWNHNCLVSEKEAAKRIWLTARNKAISFALELNKLGLHKQISNRLLEPWFHIRVILSGTEFENFFALRAHEFAQPELQKLAYLMLEEYNKSQPKQLKEGEWHIPFGDKIDEKRLYIFFDDGSGCVHLNSLEWKEELNKLKIKIAVARCARVSYFNYEGKDDYEADIKLCDRLFGANPKHLSPTEHIAQALDKSEKIGNYIGWKQYRYFFDNQNLSDERVMKKIANNE